MFVIDNGSIVILYGPTPVDQQHTTQAITMRGRENSGEKLEFFFSVDIKTSNYPLYNAYFNVRLQINIKRNISIYKIFHEKWYLYCNKN